MIRPICRDPLLLSRKAETATFLDLPVAADLADTLRAHSERCLGMAANMIGVNKRIICVAMGPMVLTMFNPVIVKKSGAYDAEEGCLSLDGVRKAARYQSIEVKWQDTSFTWRQGTYEGLAAQIIQHEMDHLEGILI
ncbi:MAG: peptide deformylase [Clostridia bacterium]|nr:peptide deformylase [Clostridia bacterium]